MKYIVQFELNDGLEKHKDTKTFIETIKQDIKSLYEDDELFTYSKLKVTTEI